MITLQHGGVRAQVALKGAELTRLGRDGAELLWQPRAGVWHQTAPWLFPVVGRVRGGGHTHQGQRYAMPLHGFAAHSVFEVERQSADAVRLRLSDSPATWAVYPFAFRFDVGYALDAAGLSIQLQVHNPGDAPLPFALGAHPGFALEGPLDDWTLQFDAAERNEVWRLDPALPPHGLLASRSEPWHWPKAGCLPLTPTLFERDALVFPAPKSAAITLVHRTHGPHLRLCCLTGAPRAWGLWARPGAPYVCIEPWWGHDDRADAPDELLAKPQMQVLAPGAAFNAALRIDWP